MIKDGKRLGYAVCTNTTIYRETVDGRDRGDVRASSTELGVDGMLLSPGYHYEAIAGEALPLPRRDPRRSSSACSSSRSATAIYSTPLFLEFAAGLRDYPCTPWGNPTRTPKGWKGPCYLIEGAVLRHLEGVLGRRRLGLLGDAPGPALPATA